MDAPSKEWLKNAAEAEANGFVSVGGLISRIDHAAVDAAKARVQIERPVSPADAMLLAAAVVALRERLAEAERKAEDMKQRNQWLRSRWDLMPNDLRKNARYKVLEDLDSCLESLRTVRAHLDCGGSVAQAVAELDAIIGKVGG